MPVIRFDRRVGIALCLASLPSLSGCFTYQTWQSANQTWAAGPHLAGLMRDYPAAGDRAMVVAYRAPANSTDVDLLVPLDAAGNPAEPFAPRGPITVEWWPTFGFERAATAQVLAVQSAALASRCQTPPGDREPLRARFATTAWSPVVGSADNRPVDSNGTPVALLAYRLDAVGRVVAVPIQPATPRATEFRLPTGTRLVLVPYTVDRPAGDREHDRAVAIVLTPLAVATDAVVIGFWGGVGLCVFAVVAPVSLPIALLTPHKPVAATTQPAEPKPVAVPIIIDGNPAVQ